MRSVWQLVKAQFHKSKSQAISFFVIVLVGAVLLNIGLVITHNYDRNYDQHADRLNSAGAILAIKSQDKKLVDELMTTMQEDDRIIEVEKRDILFATATLAYRDGEQTRNMVFMNQQDHPNISQIDYIEYSSDVYEHPIYLPWLFHTGGNYQLGDSFEMEIVLMSGEKETKIYQVAGFFEEPILGTVNSTISGVVLPAREYQDLSQSFDGKIDGTIFNAILKENKTMGENFVGTYNTLLEEHDSNVYHDSSFYLMVKQARTMTSSIGSMIIIGFSMIIVAVVLVMVKFRIGNTIEEEIRNMGVQKAIGYSNHQIILSLIVQFLILTLLGSLTGIGVSYLILPFISNMFALQTGIVWNQGFDLVSAFISVVGISLMVVLTAYLSARKIGKLTPITAIRTGIATHSFKNNPFPLETTKGNLTMLLAAKNFIHQIRLNIMIMLVVMGVSFAAMFAMVMYYNISVESTKFVEMVSTEVPTVQINAIDEAGADRLLASLQITNGVRKAAYYDQVRASIGTKDSEVFCYIMDDFSALDNQLAVYKGRFPKHDNEIAINGLLAKNMNKNIGDTVTLKKGTAEIGYLITGFSQGSNYMGHEAMLTSKAFRQLDSSYHSLCIYVYLDKGADTAGFIKDLDQYSDDIAKTTDAQLQIESILGVYQNIVTIIAFIILLITVAIVSIALYMVVKTTVIRKRQEFGIQKAIGYTTLQLVLETIYTFLPVVLIGTILGCLLGKVGLNSMLSVLFSSIGMMKISFAIPTLWMIGVGSAIFLFGLFITLVVSMRIRKISPYNMLKE
mgnify:FL=1